MNRKKTGPLATYRILQKYTDEKHLLTLEEIVDHLENEYGVTADRRTIYDNMNVLGDFDIHIDGFEAGHRGYSLNRDGFNAHKAARLIRTLSSNDEFSDLERQMYIDDILSRLSIYQVEEVNHLLEIQNVKLKKENDRPF
ncbi:MAG: hypothetical protein LKE64_02720 [Solobacterium sp.]|jgi:hypothetical protein|nr:hypothetical protein [Solobacterium sp.]MCH4049645.1 hypothetical protein [Solobacterium sp.]MCH4073330.1 hypothetical protein [Solobacterium sp.]MCI1312989.1 hypothetical protein [Solobacterium sp.]MCI1345578.1 hypothetical protein [Solobacterium sp.]